MPVISDVPPAIIEHVCAVLGVRPLPRTTLARHDRSGSKSRHQKILREFVRILPADSSPATIKVDNGSKFISKAMDRWTYEHGVELDFTRPGRPTDNAKVESFNGRFRQECLNAHWFLSLSDAQSKIDDWRTYYNEVRPHSALQWMTPAEFARQARESASPDNSTKPEISTSDRD
ncbi:integrase core domain-containing protein [Burkholderia sola]|uniref:integrase core domain-containing protein n=1 Tax=Burkholderia sola TaxID=2843302 RepID=UPI00308413CF